MAGKRANNEGSIYKRKDGRWAVTVTLDHGRRKSFYGKTRQEVAQKLTASLKARQDGLPVLGERQTVARFLGDWLESVKPSPGQGHGFAMSNISGFTLSPRSASCP